ncbi:M20/M25/M40 family metallo-hydrolase [Lysinibacter cavernae]|uniref:Acetylornithine deacetylase/succinyl-diaminopimelate desuccinylase-like protein n=1 Tax=Lysinibacter cavernae TaxID=1640652 RepID=A0A7X5QYD8_9MICO|nr:M20/M25/M40 family metallo-hydrolase [Lysinibacter cavernae]NIH52233.1 acetylornithine deacetylase/succinyl-diaminopimelate desuccinylase-like protein [Lysinibacter cavernae]
MWSIPAASALCAQLIRFDTSNFGEGKSAGERDIAEYIFSLLAEAGYEPHLLGPTEERASVVVRVEGEHPELPGILVHAHTDVVPADAAEWTRDPFDGRVEDGYVYGRGAADMKDMVAMTLKTLLEWASEGVRPQRDVVVVFVADEEDKGEYGALWLVAEHPELFRGVECAIGESGGNATPLPAADGSTVTLYPIATGERGTLHMRLRAEGVPGHGSRPQPDSAITRLLGACYRINSFTWPIQLTETVRDYISVGSTALGHEPDLETEDGIMAAIEVLGEAGDVARATIRCSATTTVLRAGYKTNVIPGSAEADVDVRCLPGTEQFVLDTIDELLGENVTREFLSHQSPVSSSPHSPWFLAMRDAVLRSNPDGVVVPVCMGGGTDAKAFAALGIETFGFTPLTADPDGRTSAGVHGIDERVPASSIDGGQLVLKDFLQHV